MRLLGIVGLVLVLLAGAATAQGICDDFNRAGPSLGGSWTNIDSAFEIQSNQLAEASDLVWNTSQILWTGATNTVDQFGRLQIITRDDNSPGLIFRSTPSGGNAGPHYEIQVSGAEVKWVYYLDASFVDGPDSCTLSSPVQDGDWLGATITGTGNDTMVEVFVSATELLPDPNAWPLPTCTLTGDPATPVDTGNRMGVRSYTSRQVGTTFMDNVCVGDSEAGPPTPTPTPTTSDTPPGTPTATPSATPTAQAQEISPRQFVVPCVTWAWEPGVTTTEVIIGYEVRIASTNSDGGMDWWWIGETLDENDLTFSVCNREYDRIFRVFVRSIYESGDFGPFSDSSVPFEHIRPKDFNADGRVGFADVGLFGQSWNTCNDLREIVPCE